MVTMSVKPPYQTKIGYTRKEFGAIFQIYSQNVYTGLFKDFSFTDVNGKYYISFREEAGKIPLITIEKRRLGPDRCLFVATALGPHHQLVEIVRSEKIDAFVKQLKEKIEALKLERTSQNVKSIR